MEPSWQGFWAGTGPTQARNRARHGESFMRLYGRADRNRSMLSAVLRWPQALSISFQNGMKWTASHPQRLVGHLLWISL